MSFSGGSFCGQFASGLLRWHLFTIVDLDIEPIGNWNLSSTFLKIDNKVPWTTFFESVCTAAI
jgi:hypothetical protein